MTPQERDVIAGIFDRLRQAANQPRDPEAERFIADRLREQPYAVYAMAQSVYVQEQALTSMQGQIEQLQAEVEQLRNQPPAPAPAQQSGGFLSGIFGGGSSQPARSGSVPSFPQRGQPQPASPPWGGQPGNQGMAPQQGTAAAPAPGTWQNQPAQQPPARGGGGFMASALTTAAGVAGGMVAGNMLMNALGGNKSAASEAKPAEASTAQNKDASQNSDAAKDTQTAADQQPAAEPQQAQPEPTYQDASYDDGSYDDSSGGGDDDWA
ncbi:MULTISPECIES: DUF2076 domain-containing protein [unclassified Bosea (in: a-proteobacteria)]|uniref:DUF2076 domain-containing protein n=1 Tax=unclassified Bosea (in: a-proteobacteria) TaxID=2653178 RepID=UPI000F76158A|nr:MULTISPECIES: DUF2076 domain-containing protein [unclassified Bosea (in: a-proteobacteria)]AZO81396.1 hypothetical protein BLM15_13115 [Bosea sp. Tri-49]RXT20456.1 hypothetical protein B5U98_18905 [Bosea sp. Tri-39]RXT37328.1 hypothetical protein B5U99_13225 [Bosea sp. Tri-54]